MHTTTATAHPTRAFAWRWGRRGLLALAALVVLIALLIGAAFLIDEPLRRNMETRLNDTLEGYTVRLPELDFHPFGFSLTLRGLRISQDAHPNPPVIAIETLDASVHWRALLRLRLVADFALDQPRLHINRAQLQEEVRDEVPVQEKGWQRALEEIYPLKINEFRITDGALTYIEKNADDAVRVTDIDILATDIRNEHPTEPYPSPYQVTATVFERGRLAVTGDAHFLADPQPTSRGRIEIKGVPLRELKPVTTQANVYVSSGILSATGEFEFGHEAQRVHLAEVVVDDLAVDYVHAAETAIAEQRRAEKVEAAAKETAEHATLVVQVDRVALNDADLGYVDHAVDPGYRVFLSDADVLVRDVSNQPEAGPSRIELSGRFMGSGATRLDATLLARKQPEIDLALKIEHTDLSAMNDVFRSYANFDVVGGDFSFFTELAVQNGQIDGYVKPLFTNIDVYDRRQDAGDSILKQVYEGVVGGVSSLLENRREDVATRTDVSGPTTSPDVSVLQTIGNLIRNAFFQSILPGFEQAVRERGQ